ncbi:MAG: DUF2332 domain-containing protein [Ilumatobacteraceae bacterium]
MVSLDALSERFARFAETSATRSPLYARLAGAAAADHDIVALLHHAPEPQQLPVLLLAAVHDLLLRGAGPQLAAHYPNLTSSPVGGDPFPAFRAFCRTHGADIVATIGTRHTQTNEVGRCALFLPALAGVGDAEGPLAHVDVGASAGLNLLLPRFHYRYEPGGSVGGPSPVTLHCATRRGPPIPPAMPTISASIGLDLAPVDVHDDDAVRWLEACVWPDQPDRFERLVAAITLAREVGVDVRPGGAVDDLAGVVTEAAAAGHPVITTSWVLNYLTGAQRLPASSPNWIAWARRWISPGWPPRARRRPPGCRSRRGPARNAPCWPRPAGAPASARCAGWRPPTRTATGCTGPTPRFHEDDSATHPQSSS